MVVPAIAAGAGIAVRLVASLRTAGAIRNAKSLGKVFGKVENENNKMNKSFQRSGNLLKSIAKTAVVAGAGILGSMIAAARKSPLLTSAFEKIKVAWMNFGLAAAPVIKPLLEGIEEIINKITKWIGTHPRLKEWMEILRDHILPAISKVVGFLSEITYITVNAIIDEFRKWKDLLTKIWDGLELIGGWSYQKLLDGIALVANKAKDLWGWVEKIWGKVFGNGDGNGNGDGGGDTGGDGDGKGDGGNGKEDKDITATDVDSFFKKTLKKVADVVVSVVAPSVGRSRGRKTSSANQAKTVARYVTKAVPKVIKAAKSAYSGAKSKVSNVYSGAKKAAKSIWGKTKSFFGFQSGGLVQRTGVAMLHQGETVTPRYAAGGGGGGATTINITTGPISSGVDLQNLATLISRELANRNAYGRAV